MTEPSLDDFLGGYEPPRRSVTITQRADLLEEHGQLQKALQLAIREDMDQLAGARTPALRARLKELEDEIRASEFTFTFQGLGSQKYTKLKARHIPTSKDRQSGLDFNSETFPPALISASSVSPEISPAQAQTLVETLSEGQLTKLWNTAIAVNVGADDAPKSVMPSAPAASNGTSSSTAAPEGSLAASSSVES